jgi:hypothetical protein
MKLSNSFRRSELKDNREHTGGGLPQHLNTEHYFKQVKSEDYTDTFGEVENWLYKTNTMLENKSSERKHFDMRIFFVANKLRLVYTVILLALVVAACNMPVTQTESAGQMITLVTPKENTDFQRKMNELPWIKNAQVTSNENTDNGESQILYRIILPNTTEEQVKAYAKELENLGGITTIRITGMNYDVKRPLYSAALHDFFKIDIDATGMSDEELKAEVESKMREQGVDLNIQFKTGPDGRRVVTLEKIGNELQREPKSYELNIEDKNGQEKIRLMEKKVDPEKFKGKTDKEIRDMVRIDTGNQDLTDDQIQIIRSGDKVQVKVNAEMNTK